MIPYALPRGIDSIDERAQVTGSEAKADGRTMSFGALRSLIAAQLASARGAWSLGSFGAVAEFQREPGELAVVEEFRVVTARGAIAVDLPPDVVAVFHERRGGHGWVHGVAFCLPQARARGSGRRVLTEVGPDRGALREPDRDAVLFDLGLGTAQCDCLVRVRDPQDLARLRAACGAALLEGDGALLGELVAMNPQRVFVSPLGRIEVFQPIPAPGGASPEGPHTHVLPRLLKAGRTHPATLALPEGLVPCLELHTPEPVRAAVEAVVGGAYGTLDR